jgi:Protein of unknown function (DUF3105)
VLERVAIVTAALVISIGVIALLSGGLLAGRDNPGVASSGGPLGIQYRDLGDVQLKPGTLHPPYDSQPPTSGAHVPVPVTRDRAELSNDQLLSALASGDVVLLYGTPRPPSGLQSLARSIAAPFTPALASAGQAVILARRPGTDGLIGLAWTRLVSVGSASNPALRSFALFWLGRGAPGR